MSGSRAPAEPCAPVEPRASPYFGLDYYGERFGAWFFGREAESSRVITNLRAARLTLLHAESGVGKSSLLRAGVTWRMRKLADDNLSRRGTARAIPVVFSSWKDDPVRELTGAINTAIRPYLAGRPAPELPPGQLAPAIEAGAGAANASLLIMLDQFEEYFLYRSREPVPERFADELARCINQANLRANFLVAIREDAYASLGDLFKGRIANVYSNYLHVDHLDRASAERAIRGPLDVYNSQPGVSEPVTIEDGLVSAVLDQVRALDRGAAQGLAPHAANASDRVATPLLQLVMDTVWQRERAAGSPALRLSTLQDLHGVTMIVDAHLAKALSSLGRSERQTAIDMLDHLVTPSGGKIAESVPDLAQRTGHDEAHVGKVLEQLDRERIVRPVPAAPGQDPGRYRRYEIFHDVLAPTINRAIAAREERRRLARLRRFAALAVSLLLVALAIGATFFVLSRNAEHQRNLAVSAQVAAEGEALDYQEPLTASLLAAAAWRIAPTSQARVSLLDALAQPDHGVPLVGRSPAVAVAFSPDGKTLATASASYSPRTGSARLWRVATRQQVAKLLGARQVTAVAFSPASARVLATAGADGTARLWDVGAGHHIRQVRQFRPGRPSRLTAIALSPGGRLLATAGADGWARLWDVAAGRRAGAFRASRAGAVTGVAFSPNGETLATAAHDGTARLWNLSTGHQLGTPLAAGPGAVNAVAFSPDGKTLATAGADGTARLWDATTGRQLRGFRSGSSGRLAAVAFSPDGRLLATGGADGFARLWEVASGGQAGSFRASRAGAVTGVAFSPDGRLLATAGADGIARLWQVAAHRMIGASIPVSLGFTSVAFSPSGKVLATAGNNMVRLWPAGRGVLQQIGTPLAAGNERMNAVAFSPDGRTIATASGDGTARLWDTATHQQVGPSLIASNGGVSSVAFRPGGNVLATASDDGTAQLWDVALPKDTDLVRAACSISGRSLLPDEWSAFIKSVPFRQVCPG